MSEAPQQAHVRRLLIFSRKILRTALSTVDGEYGMSGIRGRTMTTLSRFFPREQRVVTLVHR
jgi:hypothetical protein